MRLAENAVDNNSTYRFLECGECIARFRQETVIVRVRSMMSFYFPI